MKNFLIAILLLASSPCFAAVYEDFYNMDTNALKAGISKYILTKGGKIDHGTSYANNTFQAIEQCVDRYSSYAYSYVFNLTPIDNGTRLNMAVFKISAGSKPVSADIAVEQKIMENIKNSIKGRFLYGLGFEFDTYNTKTGKIKAPKGKENGIVLTAVKYDALKKGLQKGDIIIEINGIPTKDIPLEKYATALNARSMTDELVLTYKRGGKTSTVTLIPRLSNTKTF